MTDDLGKRLRAYRNNLGYSLKQVYEQTGITNSRLSKIEHNTLHCPAAELKKLCELYSVPAIPPFIKAGYLDQKDLQDYQTFFTGSEELDDEERKHIQWEINKFNSNRRGQDK